MSVDDARRPGLAETLEVNLLFMLSTKAFSAGI
ncbi:MAG: hypothetical protein ACI835_002872 [Planctomycetota bacterium]|jgi:hypothetical protein